MIGSRVLQVVTILALLSALPLLLSCTQVDDVPTPTQVADSSAPSSGVETLTTTLPPADTAVPPATTPVPVTAPPTATVVPSPTFAPTPEPTSTPAPTSTPTLKQLNLDAISQFSWYEAGQPLKDDAQRTFDNLCVMADLYPDLFEATLQAQWLDKAGEWPVDSVVAALTGHLLGISEAGGDDGASLQILEMPFMEGLADSPSHDEQRLRLLSELATKDYEKLVVFLEYMDSKGGITHDHFPRSLYLPYIETTHPEIYQRIEDTPKDESWGPIVADNLAALAARYPSVFRALTDQMIERPMAAMPPWWAAYVADRDPEIALRLAGMPFAPTWYSLTEATWIYLSEVTEQNPDAAHMILDEYEAQGGITTFDMDEVILAAMGIARPEQYDIFIQFDWVKNGTSLEQHPDAPEYLTRNDLAKGYFSDTYTFGILLDLVESHDTSPLLALGESLLAKQWMRHELSTEEKQAIWFLVKEVPSNISPQLSEMQFLDRVDQDDIEILRGFNRGSLYESVDFDDLINHRLIGGEITDNNRRHLAAAFDDLVNQ